MMRGVVSLPHGYGHQVDGVRLQPCHQGARRLDQRPDRPRPARPLRQRRAEWRPGHRGPRMIEVARAPGRRGRDDLGAYAATAARSGQRATRPAPRAARCSPASTCRSGRRVRRPGRAAGCACATGASSRSSSTWRRGRVLEAALPARDARLVATQMLLDLAVPWRRRTRVMLRPMTAAEFAGYREHLVASYAQDMLDAGAFTDLAAALAASEQSTAELLPDGVDTPGQHLWTAYDGQTRARSSASSGSSVEGRAASSTTSRSARSSAGAATVARCSTPARVPPSSWARGARAQRVRSQRGRPCALRARGLRHHRADLPDLDSSRLRQARVRRPGRRPGRTRPARPRPSRGTAAG